MNELTAEEARRLLAYDPDTGAFTWLVCIANRSPGMPAGTLNHCGYLQIGIHGRRYLGHRVAFLIMTGRWPRKWIDHIDRNRSNNVWTNLRECTPAENQHNQSPNCRNTSGFRGVTWNTNARKWHAKIRFRGKSLYLGYFDNPAEAGAAYRKAKARLHPFSITGSAA